MALMTSFAMAVLIPYLSVIDSMGQKFGENLEQHGMFNIQFYIKQLISEYYFYDFHVTNIKSINLFQRENF